ncbi:MAG: HDOD domain-containing protein [Vampirovibrionales bacterium]|nr:HDOD domain-containing protein [Vampirovibrionales bacterium]
MPPFTDKSLDKALKRIRDIPSLPDVVNRTLEVMANPTAPASEIARLISYDPGLTSKVLRIVNSAAYGFQRQISSVQHGIMILGFNTVRGLVLSASIFKMFETIDDERGLDHRGFWEHSMAVAMAARLIAKRFRLSGMDDAFSAGLLHDIGKMALDVYFQNEYRQVLQMAKANKRPCHGDAFLEVEQRYLGTDHCQVGEALANKWRLPVTITAVIAHHHHPEQATRCQTLAYVSALANALVDNFQMNCGVFRAEAVNADLCAYFDLDVEQLEALHIAMKAELEGIEELMSSLTSKPPDAGAPPRKSAGGFGHS